jgi:hypothetical protein
MQTRTPIASEEKDFHDLMGRIGPLAVIDVVGTALIAFVGARFLGWNPWRTVAYAFVLGEAVHLALNLETPVTRLAGVTTGKRTLTE